MRLLVRITIDESFVDLKGIRGDLTQRSHRVRERILQWTGIPCGIGIGPTNTLAKIANFIAKTAERKPGSYPKQHAQVCNLGALTQEELDYLLASTEVREVWGVGRRIGTQLHDAGIQTVLDLKKLDPATVRRRWSVVLERTVRELQGLAFIGLEEKSVAKKEIACTRSFGQPVTKLGDLQQAITEFSSRAAEKLRRQNSHAGRVLCFIRTSPFRVEDAQYSRSFSVPLRGPSCDSNEIAHAALGLQALYRPGYRYAKAGVMLMDLTSADDCQYELALEQEPANSDRTKPMQTLDVINRRYGRGTVQLASAGLEKSGRLWSMRQERRTPGYTTRWDELSVVRA